MGERKKGETKNNQDQWPLIELYARIYLFHGNCALFLELGNHQMKRKSLANITSVILRKKNQDKVKKIAIFI